MIRNILFCLTICLGLFSCKNGSDSFTEWIKKNQGQKFTPDRMNELISKYSAPTDSLIASTDTVLGFNIYYFNGPFFDATESKQIIDLANKEWYDIDIFYRNYQNSTTTDQAINVDPIASDEETPTFGRALFVHFPDSVRADSEPDD